MDETPKKKNLPRRLIAAVCSAALVLGAVALVLYRDELNLDALKRYISYRSLTTSESGQATSFPYDGGIHNAFASLSGSLLVAGESGIRLYAPTGTLLAEETLPMSNPVVCSTGEYAVVYDAGGTALRLYNGTRQLLSEECEGAILSARLNPSGALAVTHQASGRKGSVSVYDSKQSKKMQFNFSSRFVMDALLSADGSRVGIVTLGQEGASFSSYLSVYLLNNALSSGTHYDQTAEHERTLGSSVVLACKTDEGRFWMVGDNAMLTCGEDGNHLTQYDYSNRYLKEFSLDGDGFATLLLGKYRAGSAAELVVLSKDGEETASLPLNEQVLSLSAGGRYIAVLTADRLDIYTQDLKLYSSLEGSSGARRVLMRPDGTAMLIGSETAHLYLPD